jgi:rhodanese-related sulfurtransferase
LSVEGFSNVIIWREERKREMRQTGRVVGSDLLWAGYLLFLAILFGLAYQWPLVKVAMQGKLTSYLDSIQEHRRVTEFKVVPSVSLEEAHELWKGGETLFLDARDAGEYAELHIPKAINIPLDKLSESELKNTGILGLPRDRRIVVYCAKKQCHASLKEARYLQSLGFTRVMAFLDGFQAWDEAGYDVDTSR